MAMYELHLRIPTKLLTTILELIEGEGIVVSMAREETGPSALPPAKKSMRYHNGRRNKGIKGDDLLFELLSSGPKTIDQLTTALTARGFAPKSTHPLVSHNTKLGRVRRDVNGLVHLVKLA